MIYLLCVIKIKSLVPSYIMNVSLCVRDSSNKGFK